MTLVPIAWVNNVVNWGGGMRAVGLGKSHGTCVPEFPNFAVVDVVFVVVSMVSRYLNA